jgi:hypothetical protein
MSASRFFPSLILLLISLSFGCGGGSVASPDAGPPGALPTPGLVDIPWLAAGSPPLTPSPARVCPAGFREIRTDTGVQLCDPWPEGGPLDCPSGSAHFPGEAGCAAIGTACPAGEWPEGLPTDRTIVYVRAGAVGGDGAVTSPYGAIMQAMTRAPAGAVIAVARGAYSEPVEVFAGMSVWGACPAETVLSTPYVAENETAVGMFRGGSAELRNVTVRGGGALGVYVDGGSALRLVDVVVDGASGYGLYATSAGASLQLENVIVQDVVRFPSGNAGVGAQLTDGAMGTFHRVALLRNIEGQLFVANGSRATVDLLTARDSLGTGGRTPRAGLGIAVQQNAQLTLSASALDGHEAAGILVAEGGTLVATDIAIRDTGDVGVIAASAALEVRVGSTATVTGALIERARGAAVILAEDGALTLSDSSIIDTRAALGGDNSGLGASLEGTSHLTLERVLIERSRRAGIVSRDTAALDATDVVVRDTEGSGPRALGVGISLFGMHSTLTRVLVERATMLGLGVSGASANLDAHDLVVRDTRSDSVDGYYGRGFEANLGASVTADRVLLERNREVSAFLFDPATLAQLSNLVIRDSLEEECRTACPEGGLGHGVTVLSGASLALTGFVITRSALLGVQVGPGGLFSATRGEISAGPIGLNIQEPTFDVGASLSDVAFRTLERSVDSTVLPIPDTGLSGL